MADKGYLTADRYYSPDHACLNRSFLQLLYTTLGVPFCLILFLSHVWLSTFFPLSLLKTLPRIIELQTQLYNKQKEFTKGLRNKMPHQELNELNVEIKKLHQELLDLRSKA